LSKLFNTFKLGSIAKLLRSSDVVSMSENMYKTFKNVVDENFELKFKNHKKKTIVFWGKYDKATSIDSGKKIHSLIKNSKFYQYALPLLLYF